MRALNFITVTFLFLIFVSPVYAVDITTPHIVEQLNVDFEQYGAVGISRGNIQNIAINISTFQNSENQKTEFAGGYTLVSDEFGNERLRIMQKSEDIQLKYSVAGSSEIFGKHTYDLPTSYSLSGINRAYLVPAKNIQSDDKKISELAQNITAGTSTDFERVARLAIWVHNNVNYTLDLGDVAKDAIWVLDNKIGTCDEFSSLFIAMSRSVGIPAKYVSGWVYGNAGWQKHAWSEVYIGKWVPIDATWLEVGNLDATHIKFMETADNYVANQATALGNDLGTIEWIFDNTSISVKSLRESDAMSSKLFSSVSEINKQNLISIGKSAIIGLKITPKEFLVEEFTIAPCKGMDIVRINNNLQQNAILFPGKENIILWKISTNENLGTNSIYTCPITINSRFFGKKIFEITVDPRVKDSISLSADIDKHIAQVNEILTTTVNVKNANRKGTIKLGIASENAVAENEINLDDLPESTTEFKFSAGSAGKHTIYAYSDRGDVIEQTYNVYETGDVFIDRINAPEFVLINQPSYIEVYLKNNKHSEASAKLSVTLNDAPALDETSMIPPQSTKLINLTVSSNKGIQRLSFRLVSDSIEEKLAEVRVYNITTLVLEGGYDSDSNSAVLKITPVGDDLKSIEAVIGGQKNSLADAKENVPRELAFNLPEGVYDVKITYSDPAGNMHETTQKIEFKKKGLFELIADFFARIFSFLGF